MTLKHSNTENLNDFKIYFFTSDILLARVGGPGDSRVTPEVILNIRLSLVKTLLINTCPLLVNTPNTRLSLVNTILILASHWSILKYYPNSRSHWSILPILASHWS